MTNQGNNQAEQAQVTLPDEQQVADYLITNPDFFLHNAPLLNDLQIPHESGGAVSLVERQVAVLRDKNAHFETKLSEMVDAVHDNQRLHISLHRLAVNLFGADSLDDVLGIVDDELRHKLGTDVVYFRLSTDQSIKHPPIEYPDERPDERPGNQPVEKSEVENNAPDSHTYVSSDDELLQDFASLIDNKRIQCGRLSEEQITRLFMQDAALVKSAAVIPVSDAGVRGIIALGSSDEHRYHAGMGTDFLTRLADLISAAMRSQLLR